MQGDEQRRPEPVEVLMERTIMYTLVLVAAVLCASFDLWNFTNGLLLLGIFLAVVDLKES